MIEQTTRVEQGFAAHGVTVLARLATAAAGGIAFGVFTLWLQGHLDGNWSVLSNSGAVWTIVAIAIAALCSTTAAGSAAAGTVALAGEVAGYYWCAAPWEGAAVTQSEQLLWMAAALLIGPFAGLAGLAIARGSATQRAMSSLSVAGLLAGEGLYLTRGVPTYRAAGLAELVLGAATALLGALVFRAPMAHRLAAMVLGALIAGAVLAVYTAPTLIR